MIAHRNEQGGWSIGVNAVCLSEVRVGLLGELVEKVVAWDVAEREDPATATGLVRRPCLRERISRGRSKPFILHSNNVSRMGAATLENRLEELGVLRTFSRPKAPRTPLLGITVPHGETPA